MLQINLSDRFMSYYIFPSGQTRSSHYQKLNLPGLVPLILGIHGRKGEGKSFQCELVFKLMGIEPVRMSAGNWKALMPEIQSVCSELAIETLPN